MRTKASGYPSWPESLTPLKAEYIGADQLPFFVFRLQLCGGPYIAVMPVSQDVALPGGNALEDGSGSDVASCRGEGRSLRRRRFPPLYSLEIQFRHSRDLK